MAITVKHQFNPRKTGTAFRARVNQAANSTGKLMVTTARQECARENRPDLKKGLLRYQVRDVGPVVELRLVGDAAVHQVSGVWHDSHTSQIFHDQRLYETRGARWGTEQAGWAMRDVTQYSGWQIHVLSRYNCMDVRDVVSIAAMGWAELIWVAD